MPAVRRRRSLIVGLAWLSGLFCSAGSVATEVMDVRLWRAPDHTRVVLDLSGPVSHSLLQLDNPRRLVVDIANTQLRDPLTDLPLENTPIQRVRSGVRQGEDLRLVFDLTAAVRPKSFPLDATEQTGHRLVLDLFDTDVAANPARRVKSIDEMSDRRDIIIAIDAGHGGEDPGASGPNKLREKQVVLSIAKRLAARLNKVPGFTSVMIRSGDYYVSLRDRRDQARKYQADLLVSIHADAFRQSSANGASVYALSTKGATSTAAQYLADRENAADLVGGVRLADKDDILAGVLTDMSMTATLESSISVGADVLKEVDGVARLHKREVEQAGFAVLKSPDIPSILVETGFISNPKEARKLASADYQEKLASAMQRGIQSWFERLPPPGTLLAWQRSQSVGGSNEYIIARGDTLSGIAQRFSVSVNTLRRSNGLSGDSIQVGQTLVIPDA